MTDCCSATGRCGCAGSSAWASRSRRPRASPGSPWPSPNGPRTRGRAGCWSRRTRTTPSRWWTSGSRAGARFLSAPCCTSVRRSSPCTPARSATASPGCGWSTRSPCASVTAPCSGTRATGRSGASRSSTSTRPTLRRRGSGARRVAVLETLDGTLAADLAARGLVHRPGLRRRGIPDAPVPGDALVHGDWIVSGPEADRLRVALGDLVGLPQRASRSLPPRSTSGSPAPASSRPWWSRRCATSPGASPARTTCPTGWWRPSRRCARPRRVARSRPPTPIAWPARPRARGAGAPRP